MVSRYNISTSMGRITGSTNRLIYPSPFFDVASQYLPRNIREMFLWCEYYYFIHPIIHQCVTKMAEYPVTELVVEDPDSELAKKWEEIFNDLLDYKAFLVNVGLDYYNYGNSFISPFFPFVKMLKCVGCKEEYPADSILESWTYNNYVFFLNCPKCGKKGRAEVKDIYPKNLEKLKLIRWNPHHIIINGTEFGSYYYFYKLPSVVLNDWLMGQKYKVVSTPQQFLEAGQKNKLIIMNQKNVFHLKRPSVSGRESTYGIPLMFPVLKDAFLFQIFKKSMEQLLLEHAVPLRMVFPQASSAAADVSAMTKLTTWKQQVEDQLIRWRQDPNYIPILPYPLGQETIGGDAKVFLFGQEIREQLNLMTAGMGVPQEFIFGGLSFSGSNVSLKMLENTFVNYRSNQKKLTRFIARRISEYIDLPMPKDFSFRGFKMADDMQRKMYLMQLNSSRKISDTTLLAESELDSEKEDKLMKDEYGRRKETLKTQQIADAEIQSEVQLVSQRNAIKNQTELTRYQDKVQRDFQSTLTPEQKAGIDARQQIESMVQELAMLPAKDREAQLQQISQQMPEAAGMIKDMLNKMRAAGMGSSAMKPAPEQKPPRRTAGM